MTAALSMATTILILVWFFRTAERLNLPALAWAIAGTIVYYGGFALWMYVLLPPILGDSFRKHSFWLGIGMDLTAIAFGVAAAALFRSKVMLKQTPSRQL